MKNRAYQFKVSYHGSQEKIWREIEISSNSTIAELGYTILASFDTLAYHAFYFDCSGKRFASNVQLDSNNAASASETILNTLKLEIGSKFYMIYDYGMEHQFDIQLIDFLSMENSAEYPRVSDGRGNGIVDDMAPDQILTMIQKTDDSHKAQVINSSEDGEVKKWDYREFDLHKLNHTLLAEVEKIKEKYEE